MKKPGYLQKNYRLNQIPFRKIPYFFTPQKKIYFAHYPSEKTFAQLIITYLKSPPSRKKYQKSWLPSEKLSNEQVTLQKKLFPPLPSKHILPFTLQKNFECQGD